MKKFSEQLNKKANTVKLRAAEKRELRERVVSYMEYHPLPKTGVSAPQRAKAALTTEQFTEVAFPFSALMRWGAGMVAMILIFVPILAEQAVPGDSLYAVKVRFNEEVRSTLTLSPYEKVEWETERLNRRIAEARLLASEGKLTEETEAKVAQAVREHSANAQKEIEALRAEDEDEAALASIELDTTLAVQASSLQRPAGANASSSNDVSLLADALSESRVAGLVLSSSTIRSYEKLMARVEQSTTRAYELAASIDDVDADDKTEINRRLEDIERIITEAIDTKETDEANAKLLLIDVLQRTQKLVVFMTDIAVNQTVDIESIVPVVLTEEEKEANQKAATFELATKVALIKNIVRNEEDKAVIEKTNFILAEIEELESTLEASSTYIEMIGVYKDAIALADDALYMLEFVDESLPVETDPITASTTSSGSETDISATTASSSEDVSTSTTDPLSIDEIDIISPTTSTTEIDISL